ncbi:MAG: hypothetical protein CL609_24190 [Anaerolineaceae bacterium]|nr:hypothetical protein [Anaerolineaceae bacterium]
MSSSSQLLQRLRHFVQSEAEHQFSALEKQWSHPLGERVVKGWAIEGIRSGKINDGIIQLFCKTNDSRFREGDLLVLHRGNPKDPNALHIELQYDGETELEANIIKGNQFFLVSEPNGWIADQDWFDSSAFYLSALDMAADSLRGRNTILPLLLGSLVPQLDYARYDRVVNQLADSGLNPSQVEAIAQAYAVDLLHLIQGPPGSGKTFMLAHLTRLLVADGQRVLVTALTHRAIHNALNKIASLDDTLAVCKIGDEKHAVDLVVPNFSNFDVSEFGNLSGGYVVGATPFSLQSQRLSNVEFDVVIFDEASQVTLPLAIMGMLAGNKYIFIGDENQLPPITTFVEEEISKASIFAYLSERGNETMLNITYRLNDILSDWPSKTFYQNILKSSPDAAVRRLQLSNQSTSWDFVLDPNSPAVFLDLCHRNTTIRSRTEAETVVELIIALLTHGIPTDEIGVVVPYRAQSRLIRSLLRRTVQDDQIWKEVVVDTVERMQGQEREVVLVSFATASPAFAAQVADFLFQPQRLNVAVTRPRTKLILIGSHHMLDADRYDANQTDTINMLRDLIDHCLFITLPDGSLV